MLSIVIPTYNELHRLPNTLEKLDTYLSINFPEHEIVIVDDDSQDGTIDFILAASKRNRNIRFISQSKRLGKGAAVKRGCLEAKGDFILFMDADLSTPVDEIKTVFQKIQEQDCGAVLGQRIYAQRSGFRKFLSTGLNWITNRFLFSQKVLDSQCGFKIFTREVVQEIFPLVRIHSGLFDVELICLLQKFNIPYLFQSIPWIDRPGSRISILSCLFQDFGDLKRIYDGLA